MFYQQHLKQYAAQCLAEFFATFLSILLGNLSVAQNKFSKPANQSLFGINLSFSVGVYVALMVAGPISGAHINPAVSIGLLSLRKLNIVQCLFYLVGQFFGAFLACPVIYLIYLGHFNLYDGGHRQIDGVNGTADIFFTVPTEGVPNWNCLLDSIIGTIVLMIFILALGNDYNHLISSVAKPFSFVIMITTFGFTMSLNCGNPINSIRDFGPRLFAACIYGVDVFRMHDYYFWIPLVGPIIGSLIGVWIFEGYLILMKKYANLPGIAHIESVEQQIDPNLSIEKAFRYNTQARSQSKPWPFWYQLRSLNVCE